MASNMITGKTYKKIALMGGAYGNLPALQACVASAHQQNCDGLFFLGDAIGFAGHSDETLAYIFDEFDVFIAGNLESQAAGGYTSCACGYGAAEDEITGCRSFEWSLNSLSEMNKQKLAILQERDIIDTVSGKVLLCHGSPEIQNEFLYDSTVTDEQIKKWLKENNVSGFVCTHTGLPWIKQFSDGTFAVNCGVTGKPDHDGDLAIHYAIIDCSSSFDISIEHIVYDVPKLAVQLRKDGVEEIFITPLETGIWTCGVMSLPAEERNRPFLHQ